jgi:hypothetical protein
MVPRSRDLPIHVRTRRCDSLGGHGLRAPGRCPRCPPRTPPQALPSRTAPWHSTDAKAMAIRYNKTKPARV